MKNIGGSCITGSPRNPDTWPVILATTLWIDSGSGVGVWVGDGVGEGVVVGAGVTAGAEVCIGVGSGLGLVGVCRIQAAASEVTAMNRSRKMAERE